MVRLRPCALPFRGIALTLVCAWVTLTPTRADAQPRLLPDQTLSIDVESDESTDADATFTATPPEDGSRAWVRAKLMRQWGVMMLVQSVVWTSVLAAFSLGNDYPFQKDEYGCGGRAAPITTAVVGAVGLALTIRGSFGMRRHVGDRPVRFGPDRAASRGWAPLLAFGALTVAGALGGAFFHDLFCNS